MKSTIKLAVAAVALTSTAAFATNGDNLISVGAKARGMGGVGIGMSHGAETALANPAMIATVKGTEISFGGTIFMPDVETNLNGGGFSKSKADLSVIPEVAIASKVSDNFTWGIGMFGTAGMGVDYREATGAAANMNFVTNLQLMQFAVPLAYSVDGLTVAIAPVMQYGSLDMNYNAAGWPDQVNGGFLTADQGNSDTSGVAQDFGYGYNIGLAYETSGLTVGASYKSAIDMEYKGVLSNATEQFMSWGYLMSTLNDHLEQPAEIGVGASYVMGEHTFAVDYKRIKWESAKGYKDFGWEDQDVYAIGYQFAQDNYAVRAGYNYAKNPIKNQALTGDKGTYNMLNLVAFPGIVEEHYTVGGTYGLSKQTSLDLAYVYAPETKETYATNAMGGTVITKHSQQAISAQVNFNF